MARRSRVLSHWPSSPNRTCDAPAGVVERGHAVAVGARAASDAALGVVEANVLGLGGRERGKRGQCDVMIRMVDLIVVRGLNAGRVNG